MNISKILLLALFVSLSPVLLAGCCHYNSCGCNVEESRPFYRVTGWETKFVQVDTATTNGYTNVLETEVFDTLPIAYNKIGIKLLATVTYYSEASFAGFGSLMACDPLPNGYDGSKEKISSLIITSDRDFDTTHPTGTNLADLLQVRRGEYYEPIVDTTVRALPTYLAGTPNLAMFYTLLFNKTPYSGKKHIFTLVYKQSDGQTHTIITKELTFK